jgi:hypothetical protein
MEGMQNIDQESVRICMKMYTRSKYMCEGVSIWDEGVDVVSSSYAKTPSDSSQDSRFAKSMAVRTDRDPSLFRHHRLRYYPLSFTSRRSLPIDLRAHPDLIYMLPIISAYYRPTTNHSI